MCDAPFKFGWEFLVLDYLMASIESTDHLLMSKNVPYTVQVPFDSTRVSDNKTIHVPAGEIVHLIGGESLQPRFDSEYGECEATTATFFWATKKV